MRALLVRVSEDEYRLYMTFHHIITDGFSLYRVFMPELVALYEAFSRGDPSPLPEPALRYADYALWQQQWIGNEYLAEHMAYWRKHLAGELPALQLPTDHSRLAVHSPRGATQRFQFDRTMAGAIKGLSQREGVTVFAVLLASFLTLLHRYSGQEDIVVGSATAGRNYPELERVVGPFLNTVPLRTNLSGSPSFRELLGQVQGVSAEALSHDEIPFEHLVKELCPRREAGRNPIFQVMMTLEPPSAIGNQEWDLTGIDADTGATKYDLCAVLDERPDEIQGRLMCDSGLFDNSTIVRMIGHWQTLLVGALANPDSSRENSGCCSREI